MCICEKNLEIDENEICEVVKLRIPKEKHSERSIEREICVKCGKIFRNEVTWEDGLKN